MASIWKDIYNCLKDNGYDVYSPSSKVGECESKYIVVKIDTGTPHSAFSSNVDLYSIMCYVPKFEYSQLEDFLADVKTTLKKVNSIIATGNKTPSFYDDDIKAHMISIEYKNYKQVI